MAFSRAVSSVKPGMDTAPSVSGVEMEGLESVTPSRSSMMLWPRSSVDFSANTRFPSASNWMDRAKLVPDWSA